MKNKKILIPLLLCNLFSCGNTSSSENNPTIIDGINMNLDIQNISIKQGEKYNLPLPKVSFLSEEKLKENLYIEVLASTNYIYTPKYLYSDMPFFQSSTADTYYVKYTLDIDNNNLQKILTIYVQEEKDNLGIVVDGNLNDEKYNLIPSYVSGLNGNLTLKLALSEQGIYIGVDVLDNNLLYSNFLSQRFTMSDGFEVYFNMSNKKSDRLNDSCFKLQYSIYNSLRVYKASTNYVKYEICEKINPYYEVNFHGTRTLTGQKSTTDSYLDDDIGYTFETYIPYSILEINKPTDDISIAIAQRDITSIKMSDITINSRANNYYNDIIVPESLYQVLSRNGVDYEYRTMDDESLTYLYHTLHLKNNIGVDQPIDLPKLSIDGNKDNNYKLINSFKINNKTKVDTYSYMDKKGIYVYVEVDDAIHCSSIDDDIYAYDAIQVNIASESILNQNEILNSYTSNSRTFVMNTSNQKSLSYLAKDSLTYFGGYDHLAKMNLLKDSYALELYVPLYELSSISKVGLCIGVCNNDTINSLSFSNMVFSNTRINPSTYFVVNRS